MEAKLRILFLAANNPEAMRSTSVRELRRIRARVKVPGRRGAVEVLSRSAVQPGHLQQLLLYLQPHVMHFSVHGCGDRGLVLRAADGKGMSVVSGEALGDLLRILKFNVRVVVLNACYSEVQARAVVEHIDFVVAMVKGVSEDGAVELAGAFYQALAYGCSVQQAFELARNELLLHRAVRDAASIRLLVREGVDASAAVLVW